MKKAKTMLDILSLAERFQQRQKTVSNARILEQVHRSRTAKPLRVLQRPRVSGMEGDTSHPKRKISTHNKDGLNVRHPLQKILLRLAKHPQKLDICTESMHGTRR